MKPVFTVFAALLLVASCSEKPDKVVDLRDSTPTKEVTNDDNASNAPTSQKEDNSAASKKTAWTYKVNLISEGNWGYQLFDNGTMVINQTSIPAVQGTLGFETREKAEKVASFVLDKVNRGEFPPTVSREELESLNVLRNGN